MFQHKIAYMTKKLVLLLAAFLTTAGLFGQDAVRERGRGRRAMSLREGMEFKEEIGKYRLMAQFMREKTAKFTYTFSDGSTQEVELKRTFTPATPEAPITSVADVEAGAIIGALDYWSPDGKESVRYYVAVSKEDGQWKAAFLDSEGKVLGFKAEAKVDEGGLQKYVEEKAKNPESKEEDKITAEIEGDNTWFKVSVCSPWACYYCWVETWWDVCWWKDRTSIVREGNDLVGYLFGWRIIRVGNWFAHFNYVPSLRCERY